MRGNSVYSHVPRGRSMADRRLQDGEMESGKAKLPSGGLLVRPGRKFRCGNTSDLVLIYFLQLRANGKPFAISASQRGFMNQALPHLGLVETPSRIRGGETKCHCRRIHDAIGTYREDHRRFELPKAHRVTSFNPDRQTKESLRVVAAVVAERIQVPFRRKSNTVRKIQAGKTAII